jgi:hypothetical protein
MLTNGSDLVFPETIFPFPGGLPPTKAFKGRTARNLEPGRWWWNVA